MRALWTMDAGRIADLIERRTAEGTEVELDDSAGGITAYAGAAAERHREQTNNPPAPAPAQPPATPALEQNPMSTLTPDRVEVRHRARRLGWRGDDGAARYETAADRVRAKAAHEATRDGRAEPTSHTFSDGTTITLDAARLRRLERMGYRGPDGVARYIAAAEAGIARRGVR